MKITDAQKTEIVIEVFKNQDPQIIIQSFIAYICGIIVNTNAAEFNMENEGNYRDKHKYKSKVSIQLKKLSKGKKMKTLEILRSELIAFKKDLAFYQNLIPKAVEGHKKYLAEDKTIIAKAVEGRIEHFREKSKVLKKLIAKRESEIQDLCYEAIQQDDMTSYLAKPKEAKALIEHKALQPIYGLKDARICRDTDFIGSGL